mgnify:CR=1 FL=1
MNKKPFRLRSHGSPYKMIGATKSPPNRLDSLWKGIKNVGSKSGKYLVGGPWGALAWGLVDLMTTDFHDGKGRPPTKDELFEKELNRSQTAGGQSKL